jgi:uncharacterized protein
MACVRSRLYASEFIRPFSLREKVAGGRSPPDEGSAMSDDAEKRTPSNEPAGPKVDARLLEILVCPVTRAELTYDPVRQELISRAARLAYPIRDGVPIMLPEEARKLDD